jgi:hypothetical protein
MKTIIVRESEGRYDLGGLGIDGGLLKFKMMAILDITPCSLVKVYRIFRGSYCLHHQGNE